MLEPIENRNWTEFYNTLLREGPNHLSPADIGECVQLESQSGGEAFWSEDVYFIINYGQEDSVEDDVRASLEAWLEEIAKVLVNEMQGDAEYVRTLRLENPDALVGRLVASLAEPIVEAP